MKTKTILQNIRVPLFICGATLAVCSSCGGQKDGEGSAFPAVRTAELSVLPDTAANVQEMPAGLADARRPDVKVRAGIGQTLVLRTEGLTLTAVGSVRREADYTATSLRDGELPPMPRGMVNMTAAAAGYRLLPGGEHFLPCAELRVAYDPGRLPRGCTPDDIYTSYYDTAALAWVRLERVAVDTAGHEIVSLTTHFTDFVNELLKAPEMPETRAFVPTMMSGLEAASPLEGLPMIQPPTANNNGTASLSYPLAIPPGRAGMQPRLALTYNSGGGGGWLGVGWDIPVPSVTLDTRWGVPRYNPAKETEIYLLDGEQLVTRDSGGAPHPMPHRTNRQTDRLPDGTCFHARTGDAHDSIVRHGDGPREYWWEVVDRSGTTHYYGHYPDSGRRSLPCVLRDDDGNIARWPLCESRDLYGNTVRYYYDHATVKDHGAEGRQLYLDSVSYTGHREEDGYYTVAFCRVAGSGTDIPVTCNNGFKEITDQTLNAVYVKCGDSILTAWLFDMESGRHTNYKNRLVSVAKIDSAAQGMRRFLAWRCHCVLPHEDEDSVVRYTVGTHEEYVPTVIYDTVYRERDSTGKDNNGNDTVFHFTEIDTVTWHEGTDTIAVHDTAYYPVRSIEMIDSGYAGSTVRFRYKDAPLPSALFAEEEVDTVDSHGLRGRPGTSMGGAMDIDEATGLGLSRSSGWNIGGSASVGLGPVVCLSNASVGGNYSRSESSSEGLMTLVDLDGDGLADKVFVRDGEMYFCRHSLSPEGRVTFGPDKRVEGAAHFLRESSYSNTFGIQLAMGFSGSASWTGSESMTSTYFADVNGDGLVDLVDDGQVLFNSPGSDSVPAFVPFVSGPGAGGGAGGDPHVAAYASGCRGIIFDGEVDDSVTCERRWFRDTAYVCDTAHAAWLGLRYSGDPDTLVETEPFGFEQDVVTVSLYHRGWDCSHHDDSPNTDAVRVWVAPEPGTISLDVHVRLVEDTSARRRAAKHADGVKYTVQHAKGVAVSGGRLSAVSNDTLRCMHICNTCYEERVYSDSAIEVERGDLLFFRLQSIADRRFDNVNDSISIQYATGNNGEYYDSKKDHVVSGYHCFQAPVDGWVEATGDVSGFGEDKRLKINTLDSELSSSDLTGIWYEGSINRGDTVVFEVNSTYSEAEWGGVVCRPHVTFLPATGQKIDVTEASGSPSGCDSVAFTDTVRGWTPCRMDIVHKPSDSVYNRLLYRRLFGPLYHGWGQFAYRSPDTGESANLIRLEKLVPPDMLVPGVTAGGDTVGMDGRVHSGDNLDTAALSGSPSLEAFRNRNSLYSPIPDSGSCWVEMTADAERQAWVSFGGQNTAGRGFLSNSLPDSCHSVPAPGTQGAGSATDGVMVYDDPVPVPSADGTPAKAVRKVSRSNTLSWSTGAKGLGFSGSAGGNAMVMDYMDLNGDRYPDIVGRDRVQYSQQWGGLGETRDLPALFSLFYNTLTTSSGKSYSASPIKQDIVVCGSPRNGMYTLRSEGSGSVSGGGNIGHDNALGSWTDINGDGLADFVTLEGKAYLNRGYGFLGPEPWGGDGIRSGISGSVTGGLEGELPDEFFNVWQGSIKAGVSVSGSYNQTKSVLMDINGDGLPDRIVRHVPDNIADIVNLFESTDIVTTVSYNMGDGKWSQPYALNIDRFHASVNYSESANAGLSFGFTLFGFKVVTGVSGSPASGSVNRDHIQLVDVDADGLPDLVSSDRESVLKIRRNLGGGTNLLTGVVNCSGAEIVIEYGLSEPDRNQPSRTWLMKRVTTLDTLNRRNGSASTVTEYAYANPYYDRHERTSYGYGTVTETQKDPATGAAYRKTDREYYNRDLLHRGKLRRELTYVDSSARYIEKRYDYRYVDCFSSDTLDADTVCSRIYYPAAEAVFTAFYEGGSLPLLVTGELTEFDRYHNVTRYTDLGDTADHGDGLEVEFSYYGGLGHNLVGLRKGYTVSAAGSAAVLREAAFEYDTAHGKLVRQMLVDGADTSVFEFRYGIDYGNLDTAMCPADSSGDRMTYVCIYDSVVNTYPATVANSFGEKVSTTYDCRFGKPMDITDPTGSTMSYRYDFAGRLVSVTSPLNTSGRPSLRNEYHPVNYYHNGLQPPGYTFTASPTGHPYSVSRHCGDNGDPVTETAVLANGFGQPVQTKKGLQVGQDCKMQVAGRSVTDAFGRQVERYDPVVEDTSTCRGMYNAGTDAALIASTSYDVLDRPTNTVQPLGVTTRTAYRIAADPSGHRCFVTESTDPNGNTTIQYSDYGGRRVLVEDAAGGKTLFTYDALGQLTSSTDPEGFATTYAYDGLGRLTRRTHPDAGATSYSYDGAGNLLRETNPSGAITYTYSYNRMTAKSYSGMTDNNVEYTYGDSGTATGRPVCIVDGSGRYECEYDALGNVVRETRSIAVPGNDGLYRFSTGYQYDSWGRMTGMTYPDGEEVFYGYQWGGDLQSLKGVKNGDTRTYVSRIEYNIFGQKSRVYYGNGTMAEYAYDTLHRLANLKCRDGNNTLMQDIGYSFDFAGNVTGMKNLAGVVNGLGGGYTNHYRYDALHRLVHSDDTATGWNHYTDMSYTPSGRILGKTCAARSGQSEDIYDRGYGYCNHEKPHAARRMYDRKNGLLYDFRWDASGNLGQVSAADAGLAFESGRFLYWTEDSRMHAAVDDKHYSYYAYDHGGERRVKLAGRSDFLDVNAESMSTHTLLDSPTLYPSPYLVLSNHGYTKHYYAGAERVAARIGGGGLGDSIPVVSDEPQHMARADRLFAKSHMEVNDRELPENNIGCIMQGGHAPEELGLRIEGIPKRMKTVAKIDCSRFVGMLEEMLTDQGHGVEPEVYFYHSDHLGGANWITDADGKPVQHLQYMPFGEPFVNQRTSGYNERFTFTGKERDEETGYGYFGARYMDYELTTMWLSVDQMSDKYPSISPYAYCAWNPVRLVDPDGNEAMENYDGWKVDRLNKTITRISSNGGDYVQYVEGDGAPIRYNTSRSEFLNEYKDYKVIDNVNINSYAELNPTEEGAKTDGVSPNAISGSLAGGAALGFNKMSKSIFDYGNGTYMGKDGSTKIMQKGKNGGLNGRYKTQIKTSSNYLKAGRIFTAIGIATAIASMDNTEVQYRNGDISQGERWMNHAIDALGCTPIGCFAPLAYDLGKRHGPSTWFKK